MLGSLHKQWPGGHCKSGLSDLAGAESGCWGSLNHVRRGMQSQRSFRVKYMCQMYVGATPHASCRGTSVPGRCESCHVPTVCLLARHAVTCAGGCTWVTALVSPPHHEHWGWWWVTDSSMFPKLLWPGNSLRVTSYWITDPWNTTRVSSYWIKF